MSAFEIVTSKEFDEKLGRKSCVFFWAAWHEPSRPGGQMDEVKIDQQVRADVYDNAPLLFSTFSEQNLKDLPTRSG